MDGLMNELTDGHDNGTCEKVSNCRQCVLHTSGLSSDRQVNHLQ